jgi:hypothetical protein
MMKNKKILLPSIILFAAVLAAAVCAFAFSIAQKPTVTEGAFPFSITYELDGKTETIDEIYKARYVGSAGYADSKGRVYVGEIGNLGENNTVYTLKQNENGRIELWTKLYPDYLMGDAAYDYFDDEDFAPAIYYYDTEETEYHDEETLAEHGVKLVDFQYPTPIKNTLTFSHLSYLSGVIVLPLLLIALLALIVTMVLVKKEKELKYKAVDIISIVLNFVIGTIFLAFVTLLAVLIDIEGGGPELYYQAMYFVPFVSLLSIAASVALRRIGYGVRSLIATLIGPVAFAVYLTVFYAGGLL